MGRGRRFFVQIDGLMVFFGGFPRHGLRQLIRFLQRNIAHRHEGHHIHAADARVLADMVVHIDDFLRDANGFQRCEAQRLRFAHDGDHAAVVFGIRGIIQQANARLRAIGAHQTFHLIQIPSFAEIRNRFDQLTLLHALLSPMLKR